MHNVNIGSKIFYRLSGDFILRYISRSEKQLSDIQPGFLLNLKFQLLFPLFISLEHIPFFITVKDFTYGTLWIAPQRAGNIPQGS